MNVDGRIIKYDGYTLYAAIPFDDEKFLRDRRVESCVVILEDGRTITALQRRYIYAILRDISMYTGHEVEFLKGHFKADVIARTGGSWFSLSNCSMTEANDLINVLIQFCVEWQIPTKDNLADLAPSMDKYMYWCLKNKVCCITRRPRAQLHHVDRVGMGRSRKEIDHAGMRAMPLTAKLHEEAHATGQASFDEKYHIHGIALTPELCRVWGVRTEEKWGTG